MTSGTHSCRPEYRDGFKMMDMSSALIVVMVVMMVVMMGGMVAGGAWAILRRGRRDQGDE